MSNGLLGKALSVANTEVIVYTVPASDIQFSTVSINLVNQDTSNATVKIAITTSLTAAAADYIDFGAILEANGGVLERTCFVCSPGENIIVESSNSLVSIRVHGLEKPISGV